MGGVQRYFLYVGVRMSQCRNAASYVRCHHVMRSVCRLVRAFMFTCVVQWALKNTRIQINPKSPMSAEVPHCTCSVRMVCTVVSGS